MQLEPCTMSGEQSASAQITALPGKLMAVDFLPPSSGTATLKIYNTRNADTTKKVIFEYTIAAGLNASSVSMPVARHADDGIYCVLSGSSTVYNIGYSLY